MKRAGEMILVIRPEPNGLDGFGQAPAYRLKRLLKAMQRRYGWRCVSLVEVSGDDVPVASDPMIRQATPPATGEVVT